MTKARKAPTTNNGNGKLVRLSMPKNLVRALNQVAFDRRALIARGLTDPRRDLDAECGYPDQITSNDYKKKFLRGDIASRVVSIWPEESWAESPNIFETEEEDETAFEKQWEELEKRFNITTMLERVDVLSGVGRFGILLLGIDDGKGLNEPIEAVVNAVMEAAQQPVNGDVEEEEEDTPPAPGEAPPADESAPEPTARLLYLRAFDEDLVSITRFETDVKNPRYGLPIEYSIMFQDHASFSSINPSVPQPSNSPTTAQGTNVHWSRVLHVADNRTSSDVYGLPRMEKVFDRLCDIKKIVGGGGEMFYKGGFPGLALEAGVGEDESVEVDVEATEEQMKKYFNGLQRYILGVGMQAKSLAPNVSDPAPHVEVNLKLIAMAQGIPWRIFVGSEAAQLASEQDTRSWNKRVDRRRKKYLTPYLVRPVVERLIQMGVLTEPEEVIVHWPDLHTPSDQDKATVAEKITNAMAKYVQAGVDQFMPPFFFLTTVLQYEDDEARAIMEEVDSMIEAGELPDPTEERERERELEDRQFELEANPPVPPMPPQRGFARNKKKTKRAKAAHKKPTS